MKVKRQKAIPLPQPPDTILIELGIGEAEILMAFIGMTSGPSNGPSGFFSKLYNALQAEGIKSLPLITAMMVDDDNIRVECKYEKHN